MDYDDRKALVVEPGERVEFEVKMAGLLGAAKWFLSVRDPHIRISAWLAAISLILGLVSLMVSGF